ncbi:hypothetical protein D3C76_1405120 [compost metagenome]
MAGLGFGQNSAVQAGFRSDIGDIDNVQDGAGGVLLLLAGRRALRLALSRFHYPTGYVSCFILAY